MSTQEQYIDTYLKAAEAAGKKYNINPVVILAQGAHESGYGKSRIAQLAKNFFGITAAGPVNDYWKGGVLNASTGLKFRTYATPADSFMDFARLISAAYPAAAKVSFNPPAYAKAISLSRYISEQNGDNRPAYEKAVNNISAWIAEYLKKKGFSVWSGSGNSNGTASGPGGSPETKENKETIMITVRPEIVGEASYIEPEKGCFKILLRNIGDDNAIVLGSAPLNPNDPDLIIGCDDPRCQLLDKITINFEGVSANKQILAIKTISL